MTTTAVPNVSRYGNSLPLGAPYFRNDTRCLDPAVPGLLDVSIAGRGFVLDTQFEAFRRESLRSQSLVAIADKKDWSNIPGSASVNTQNLWRRGMEDWSKGAGQEFLDRYNSDSKRFYKSKGIYPWLQNYASLLQDTVAIHSSGNETQVMSVGKSLSAPVGSGGNVYIVDGGTVKYSSGSLSSWTTVTGLPTVSATNAALATDGLNVYIACGTSGIYIAEAGTSTAYSWITGSVNNVWYAGGQLLCSGPNAGNASSGNLLYSIWLSTPSWPTTPTPKAITVAGPSGGTALLLTQQNADFVWDCCAAGTSWIYLSGRSSLASGSGFSFVFKTQVNTTGTSLTVPTVAATLPGGELVYSLYAYGNFIMLGTSLGARFCQTLGLVTSSGTDTGDLKVGPIVPDEVQQVTRPVRCFTGQFRFAWFGWSNYDAISTGLGRMDLSTFIDSQAPAYTSDLMVSGSGEIISMDWYDGPNNIEGVNTGSPVFIVAGLGVYTAAATYVPQGTIDTGYVTYGLPDNKVGLQWDFEATGNGTVGAIVTVDDNTPGAYSVANQTTTSLLTDESLPTMVGELFDIQVQLNASAGNTGSPLLRRFMVKASPAVAMGTMHIFPLNQFSTVRANGIDIPTNPYETFAYLDALRQSATPVAVWKGSNFINSCVIYELDCVGYKLRPGSDGGFDQVIVVFCKSLEG